MKADPVEKVIADVGEDVLHIRASKMPRKRDQPLSGLLGQRQAQPA